MTRTFREEDPEAWRAEEPAALVLVLVLVLAESAPAVRRSGQPQAPASCRR